MDIVLSRILKLKSEKKISDTQFTKDLHFYSSIVSEWKNGSSKSYMKHLPKIADYFGTTVDAILNGETDTKEQPATNDDGLTEEQREIIELFDRADPEVQRAALEFLRAIERREHKPDNT